MRSYKNKRRERIKRVIKRRMCRIHVSMGYSSNSADRQTGRRTESAHPGNVTELEKTDMSFLAVNKSKPEISFIRKLEETERSTTNSWSMVQNIRTCVSSWHGCKQTP